MSNPIPKLLFLGTDGSQSSASLNQLLRSGFKPCAIAVHQPGPTGLGIPVTSTHSTDSTLSLGTQSGLTTYGFSQSELPGLISNIAPDWVLVSCYPKLIPQSLLQQVPGGWLNIHPSPLPAYRGPSPVFWQLRDGLEEIGVSLHLINSQFDRGPIIARSRFNPGINHRYHEISEQAGILGAKLFLQQLPDLAPGKVHGRVQSEADASYQPPPKTKDFKIEPHWAAHRIFRFVRGTCGLGAHWIASPDNKMISVIDAIELLPDAKGINPFNIQGNELTLSCYDGRIKLQINTS
ncbi:MAG: hypothetical protein GY696_17675 [Gammaproteobacteria bacterium]|nr:hypothetical protein [Gammaproteobacteria bacterium]